MSGQQIGTVVGGAIGFYFGGPAGAQLGMAIGGTIGGAVDPEVIKAPSIGDAQSQTAQAGVPRPVVYGHPAPFSGNIIDGESKARKIIVEEGGKGGGPVVESERFLLTTAIRICEGPIAGVVRIWRNGKVVYDRRTIEDMPVYSGGGAGALLVQAAQWRAYTAAFQNRVRIYLGDEDQLPDSALEAIHGVGNTPYYLGTAYMVIEDDDVTDTRGAAAQYQFEVLAAGTEGAATVVTPDQEFPPSVNWSGGVPTDWIYSQEFDLDISSVRGVMRLVAASETYDTPVRVRAWITGGLVFDSGWMGDLSYAGAFSSALSSFILWRRLTAAGIDEDTSDPALIQAYVATLGSVLVGLGPISSGTINVTDATTMRVEIVRPEVAGVAGARLTVNHPKLSLLPETVITTPELPGAMLGSDGLVYYPSWETPSTLTTITPGSVWLDSVVEDIALRCDVPAGKLDASALSGQSIPGLLVANQTTGADCLRPTQQMFFYDLPEVDGQIVAMLRGGSSVATITDDDLLETGDEDEAVRPQQIEYPAKVSVFTQDPAAEYSAVPQVSIRTSPNIKATSEVTVQSPIPFSANEAKRKADVIHKVLFSQAEGRRDFSLPEEYSRLVPSDAFMHNGKRWLIEQKDSTEGENRFKCVYDRASAYTSAAVGIAPTPPALPTSSLRGPTRFIAMNLPALRSQDNSPGMYVAAAGLMAGWVGCIVQVSYDGGETFSNVLPIATAATMGMLSAAYGPTSGAVLVSVRGDLSSATEAQLAARANAFAVVGATTEVGQFSNASLDTVDGSISNYTLTGIAHGRLGTQAASHATGEPFVLLNGAVLFLPIDIGYAGRTLIFRAVTLGTVPANNATFSVVYDPQLLSAPVLEYYTDAGGNRYTDAAGAFYFKES